MSTPSALLALASVSLLCGCFTPRATRDVQTWLLYVREVPVAHVVVDGASTGNVVDVSVRGNTAAVTLRHRGQASLVPVPDAHPPGLELAFKEDLRQPAPAPPRAPANLRRLLSERKYDDIQRALDEAASTKRDDLAMELLEPALDSALRQAAEDERGRRLLDRLVDEVTSGHVGDDERQAALWLIALKTQLIPLEKFARAVLDPKTKVLHVRKQGITVMKDAPLTARRRPDGGVDVSFPVRVYQFDKGHTLPSNVLHLPENEVVCAKLHDEGGQLFCAPPIFLVQLSNEADMQLLYKGLEMGAWGLTAGAGALAGAGVRATTWAKVLLWCDRAAALLGVLTSVVAEHRGWILEEFGERGERFLRYVDGVNSAVVLYGLARVATAVPHFLTGLHAEYQRLKAARAMFSAEERAALEAIGGGTRQLAREVDGLSRNPETSGANVVSLERTRAARQAAQAAPAVEEVPLRATGTEGRLVPLRGGEAPRELTVASSRPGQGSGPGGPLRPSPPEQRGASVTGTAGPRVFPAGVSLPPREVAIAAELVKKGVLEHQAWRSVRLAAELGVLDDVEALARSKGYRNPAKLPDVLDALKEGNRGHAQALQDAAERARLGHEVALENGAADVVDYSVKLNGTVGEAIQHKLVLGKNPDTAKDSIRKAAGQLRGEGAEVPPSGFTRTIDLRFDPKSTNPLQNANRAALETWLREVRADVYAGALQGVERIRIQNAQGIFLFEAPFK